MNLKIALIDNDHVVRAKTDLSEKGQDDLFRRFLRQIKEELVPQQIRSRLKYPNLNDNLDFPLFLF